MLGVRYVDLLLQDRKNLLILLLQAPVIGYLITLVARSDAMVGPRASSVDAQTILFMLSTVAVWFGIINAAREITKEAAVYRRERLAGLRVGAYVLSKVLVLALLVAVQSAALLAVVGADVRLPARGILMDGAARARRHDGAHLARRALARALHLRVGADAGPRHLVRAAGADPPDPLLRRALPLRQRDEHDARALLVHREPLGDGRLRRDHQPRAAATGVADRAARDSRTRRENLVAKWQILGAYAAGCFLVACARLALRDEERS